MTGRKATAAIVGSGSIGTELMYKLLRSKWVEPRWMVGVDPWSEGLRRAADCGLRTTARGTGWLGELEERPDLVFETSPGRRRRTGASPSADERVRAINFIAAAFGPYVIPPVNLDEHLSRTTAPGIEAIESVRCGTAIIVLNPADPPVMMRNTIFCAVSADSDIDAITASVRKLISEMAGDCLAPYAGTLDVITAVAVRVGDAIAQSTLS
jgi:acetaldehyde dehydrogenase